ncbi:MAG: flagellar hook-length control protein FliK [Proteobacteria bacterium]|nr:flagellar hook-length control protein FliK [Pseudomonadota bacterium]
MLTQAFQDLNITRMTDKPMGPGIKSNTQATDVGKSFKSLMENLISKVDSNTSMDMDTLMSLMNAQDMKNSKATDIMALLAGKIQQNGIIPSNRFVGEEGIAALKTILNGMGFNQEKIDSFIQSLKQGQDKDGVSLSRLLSNLGNFLKESSTKDELDISDLPYIASLLNSFGFEPKQVEHFLKHAGKSGEGIDLDTLVADLKTIQASKNSLSQTTPTGQENLMKGLGLESGRTGIADFNTGKKGTLSLDEFVNKLETLIREKNPTQASPGALENAAQTFGNSIKSVNKIQTADGTAPSSISESKAQDTTALRFGAPTIKSPQPSSGEKSDSAFFSGAKADALKMSAKETPKESLPSFEKSLKESTSLPKDGTESPAFAAKSLSGTDIYGRVSDLKASQTSDKTLPAYVTDQVARQISKAVKLGESEIKFHIRPPDMGRVQLSIENTREGVKISILTEQHTTRDMILSHTTDLKAMLSDQGIRLDKIDVDVSGNFGQSMAQARQNAEHSGKERRNKNQESFSPDNIADENLENPTIRSLRYTKGNLDLVA